MKNKKDFRIHGMCFGHFWNPFSLSLVRMHSLAGRHNAFIFPCAHGFSSVLFPGLSLGADAFEKTSQFKFHVSSVLEKTLKKSGFKACVGGNLVYFCTRIQGEVLRQTLKIQSKKI